MSEPIVIGQVLRSAPEYRASCTFPCLRCGCLLVVDANTPPWTPLNDARDHECCGVRYRFLVEARVEVSGVGKGACPIHGEPVAVGEHIGT